ncbi:TPR and SET domain containing protein [Rhodotorula toruloides]|uniref:TPR and SET domain containing protein n=1 Tax=Rhodotorula toruloides TaxID=5286 RepID=A0A511KJ71_RHOTO|nr:TPR and SET domain containing protein [Rhodotorula toruloides]
MSASDRSQLIKDMESSRNKASKLFDGPGKSEGLELLILGAPRFCSTRALHELKPITFKDMRVTKTHKGRVLLLRIVSVPCHIVGISFAAEDTNDRVEHIAIYNFPLHGIRTGPDLAALFPVGTLCAFREPSFRDPENRHAKAIGNGYFAQRKDYLALQRYSKGLACCSSPEQRLVYYLNRAQANLRLSNFGGAWRDASAVLSFLKAGISRRPPRAEVKATVRRARALEGLRHFQRALEEYMRVLALDVDEPVGHSGRTRTEKWGYQSEMGDYDWPELHKLAIGRTVPFGLPIGD